MGGRGFWSAVLLCSLGAAAGNPSPAHAQATGTLLGTVADVSGGILPGTTVTVRNSETGRTRDAVTGATGTYRVVSLAPGTYDVTAALSGFKTSVQTGVVLSVGETLQVNFSLELGSLEETVAVVASVVRVDTAGAALGGLVDVVNIRELPLNGRDWLQLVTLQAGTNITMGQSAADGSRAQRGLGTAVAISGGRGTENAFHIDGLVVNDYANSGPGSALQVNLGVDAIQEFKVMTNSYSAEYGRGSGGVVTAVTKSGTNSLHGSAFYFHRNSAFDSPQFRDPGDLPPFHRHQFGGSAGAPLVRDRTFFFVNYESLRERLDSTQRPLTLTAAARQGHLTTGTVPVDPRVAKYLALLPDPNGEIRGDSGEYVFESGRTGREDFVTAKVDHHFSQRTSLAVTYSFDDAEVFRSAHFNQVDIGVPSRRQYVIANLQHAFSSAVLNTFRVGTSRINAANEVELRTTNPLLEDPSMGFLPGRNMGSISVPGISFPQGLGAADGNVFRYLAPQIGNDLSWLAGRHSLRFGFGVEHIRSDVNAKQSENGIWRFDTLEDFLLVRPTQFDGMLPGADTQRNMRTTIFSAYVQDDFRVKNWLTVNLGLRYEANTVITETEGRLATLRNVTDAEPHLGDPCTRIRRC